MTLCTHHHSTALTFSNIYRIFSLTGTCIHWVTHDNCDLISLLIMYCLMDMVHVNSTSKTILDAN